MERKLKGHFTFTLIRLIGLFSIYFSVKELFLVDHEKIIYNLIAIALFYLLFSPFAATLPSGANWRPGMAFIFFSLLYFDYKLVILVAIPGTFYIARGKKGYWSRFLLTIGHLAIGIYGAGMVRGLINVEFSANLISYVTITFCLFVHFCLNRLVAAYIVSCRKKISFIQQVNMIKRDLNWGYFCAYILGILMYLVFRVYSVPGLLLVILLLITIYQAVSYFQKLKDIEEKVYLDVLTGAENRTAWEEYQNKLDDDYSNRSGIIFMMDLDHFKMMNDTFGHDFGDDVLKEFVSKIQKEIKRKFRLFRYGGDEFVLVVDASVEEYTDVSQEIRTILFLQNEHWQRHGLAVSVSFGQAYLSDPESIADIVRRADKLMYMNKFEKDLMGKTHADVKMAITNN